MTNELSKEIFTSMVELPTEDSSDPFCHRNMVLAPPWDTLMKISIAMTIVGIEDD